MFKLITNTSSTYFSIFIAGLILIAVNFIGSFCSVKYDVTAEQLFTLSDNTTEALKKLDKQVNIRFYYSKDLEENTQYQKTFAKHISSLLSEIERISNGNIRVEKLNPSESLSIVSAAELDGVEGVQLASGSKQFFGLAFSYLDKTESIQRLTSLDEKNIEYQIIRNIIKIIKIKKKVIGVISPLPVLGVNPTAKLVKAGNYEIFKPWVAFNELKEDFILKKLPIDINKIEGVDALAIIHPVGLSPKTKFLIDQYILKGGKVFIALDPFSFNLTKVAKKNKAYEVMTKSTLPAMLNNWGITLDTKAVLADTQYATTIKKVSDIRTYINVPVFKDKAFNQKSPITSTLNKVNFIYPGGFVLKPKNGVIKSILITSTKDSSLINNKIAETATSAFTSFKADKLSYPVAIKISGKWKTAYPNYVGEDKVNSLTESAKEGTIILVSDTDFMENQYTVIQQENAYGAKYNIPRNDNINFLHNIFDNLCGDENLTKIRSRQALSKPFSVLEKIERDAQSKFKDEMTQLQEELLLAQKKIQDLQALKDKDNQTVLSPDQKRELEIFKRKQQVAMKKVEKYKKTYQDAIDKIVNKLKLINIFAMPIFVIIIGLIIALIARKRQNKKLSERVEFKDNKKNNKVLMYSSLIAVVLIGLSCYIYYSDLSTWDNKSERGVFLFENLDVNSVGKIEIITEKKDFIMAKESGKWLLKSLYDYPADFKQISELLLLLSDIKVIHSINIAKENLSELYLDKNGPTGTQPVELKIFDNNNKLINSILLGKYHIAKILSEDNPFMKKDFDGRYVKKSDKVFLLDNTLMRVNPVVAIWMMKNFVKFSVAREVSYRTMTSNDKWNLYRTATKIPFEAQDMKDNEYIDYKVLNTIMKELYEIAIIDVLPLSSFKFATKVKAMIAFHNFRGFAYYIKIIENEEKFYVKLDVLYTPESKDNLSKEDKKRVSNLKKQYEDEQFFTKWLFEIDKESAKTLMQSRSALIKLKPKEKSSQK